jgi:hypothetical protein
MEPARLFSEKRMRVAVVCLLFASTALGQESKEKFLAVYEPAFQKLKNGYHNMRLKATLRTTGAVHRSLEITYMASGDLFRLEIANQTRDGKPLAVPTNVYVSNPAGSFQLARREPSDPYFITSNVAGYKKFTKAIAVSAPVVFAPFCWRDYTILGFFKDSNITITKISSIEQNGETLTRVDWDINPKATARHLLGWFLFDQARCWALRGSQLDESVASIEYGESYDGVPLIKTFEEWTERNGGKLVVNTYTVQEIAGGGPDPEREFTLGAFGLVDVGKKKAIPFVYYLIAFGLIGLFLSFLFRRLALRRQ